jgi:hypothetical protein
MFMAEFDKNALTLYNVKRGISLGTVQYIEGGC